MVRRRAPRVGTSGDGRGCGPGRSGWRRPALRSHPPRLRRAGPTPDSRLRTWDVILGGYGSDVTFLDRALAQTFKRCAVDPAHLAIEGFSDGASYALSLGLANGDLFTHIIAFSPGFMVPAGRNGMPHIYISHGRSDPVLSVDRCSRRIVPQLQSAGYDVHYHEFTGFHTVPQGIAREALRWFVPTKEKL